jgi:hypothetical protein
MKVMLKGEETQSLRNKIISEGDEVVLSGGDFILQDVLSDTKELCPRVNGRYVLPDLILEAMGLSVALAPVEFYVMKWFDSKWSDQTLVLMPLNTLMDKGLGPQCLTGWGCRYVHGSKIEEIFNKPLLIDYLKSSGHIGFVSIGLSSKSPEKIVNFFAGSPPFALCNVVEGCQGKISEFLTGELPILLESWTVGLAISLSPFPFKRKIPRVDVKGLTLEASKHLWPIGLRTYKKTCFSDDSLLCFATAWAKTLHDAAFRVLRTARGFNAPGLQYRQDPAEALSDLWYLAKTHPLMGL